MSKLRILCLHGFSSNGSVHAHQVRNLTGPLSTEYEFLFPDGPHKVSLGTQMDLSKPSTQAWADFVSANSPGTGHRAWWYARDPDPETQKPGTFEGLEESLTFIGELIRKTGPVHGIWGFSQGACFAGMLTALLGKGNRGHEFRHFLPKEQGTPMAGIFFSGFRARFVQYRNLYEPSIEIPTMHVMGEADLAVSVKRSVEFAGICEGATILRHAGGHDIPKKKEDQEMILRFLRENLRVRDRQSL
jgi:hypothetical protein